VTQVNQPNFAQDPGELFDIVRADGTPTGQTKPRAEVHRDGDWHRAVHVWVTGIGANGEPFLMMQRRNEHKDTWPGRLDATVGGHYRAGESRVETLRETEEEIGVTVDLDELRAAGVRIAVGTHNEKTRDQELQDVFLLRSDRPLTAYRPNPAELDALIHVPLASLLDLYAGDQTAIDAQNLDAKTGEITIVMLTLSDFIPSIDRYFYRVGIAAQALLRGDRHIAV
jgi:isopentenyldiphosphate isomerase